MPEGGLLGCWLADKPAPLPPHRACWTLGRSERSLLICGLGSPFRKVAGTFEPFCGVFCSIGLGAEPLATAWVATPPRRFSPQGRERDAFSLYAGAVHTPLPLTAAGTVASSLRRSVCADAGRKMIFASILA